MNLKKVLSTVLDKQRKIIIISGSVLLLVILLIVIIASSGKKKVYTSQLQPEIKKSKLEKTIIVPQILDKKGDAVEGATVIVGNQVTTTDSNGRWLLNQYPSKQDENVFVMATGYIMAKQKLNESETINLEPRSLAKVSVTVYDYNNKPLNNSYVLYLDGNSYSPKVLAKTDKSGVAQFNEVPESRATFLVIMKDYKLGWILGEVSVKEKNDFSIYLSKRVVDSKLSQLDINEPDSNESLNLLSKIIETIIPPVSAVEEGASSPIIPANQKKVRVWVDTEDFNYYQEEENRLSINFNKNNPKFFPPKFFHVNVNGAYSFFDKNCAGDLLKCLPKLDDKDFSSEQGSNTSNDQLILGLTTQSDLLDADIDHFVIDKKLILQMMSSPPSTIIGVGTSIVSYDFNSYDFTAGLKNGVEISELPANRFGISSDSDFTDVLYKQSSQEKDTEIDISKVKLTTSEYNPPLNPQKKYNILTGTNSKLVIDLDLEDLGPASKCKLASTVPIYNPIVKTLTLSEFYNQGASYNNCKLAIFYRQPNATSTQKELIVNASYGLNWYENAMQANGWSRSDSFDSTKITNQLDGSLILGNKGTNNRYQSKMASFAPIKPKSDLIDITMPSTNSNTLYIDEPKDLERELANRPQASTYYSITFKKCDELNNVGREVTVYDYIDPIKYGFNKGQYGIWLSISAQSLKQATSAIRASYGCEIEEPVDLTSPTPSTTPVISKNNVKKGCYDTDEGVEDYMGTQGMVYIDGKIAMYTDSVSGATSQAIDTCIPDKDGIPKLREFYCNYGEVRGGSTFFCDSGRMCKGGKCVKIPEPPEPAYNVMPNKCAQILFGDCFCANNLTGNMCGANIPGCPTDKDANSSYSKTRCYRYTVKWPYFNVKAEEWELLGGDQNHRLPKYIYDYSAWERSQRENNN